MGILKPCPFCGGEAVMEFDPGAKEDYLGRRWAYNVVCTVCCASSGNCISKEHAEEAWSRRVDNG